MYISVETEHGIRTATVHKLLTEKFDKLYQPREVNTSVKQLIEKWRGLTSIGVQISPNASRMFDLLLTSGEDLSTCSTPGSPHQLGEAPSLKPGTKQRQHQPPTTQGADMATTASKKTAPKKSPAKTAAKKAPVKEEPKAAAKKEAPKPPAKVESKATPKTAAKQATGAERQPERGGSLAGQKIKANPKADLSLVREGTIRFALMKAVMGSSSVADALSKTVKTKSGELMKVNTTHVKMAADYGFITLSA